MIPKISKKQEGLMLVELLIVLSLLGVVLATGYMYFFFGVQTYNRGERLAIAQKTIRDASDVITSEIRFANQLIINPNKIDGFSYIYRDENNSIILVLIDEQVIVLADSQDFGISYNIIFYANEVYDDLISFRIEADNDLYYLETSVHAVNLKLADRNNAIIVNNGDGSIVKYIKP